MRRRLLPILISLAALPLLLGAAKSAAPKPFTMDVFSPQGEVKPVRQISARFSRPVVALGSPSDEPAPLDCDCPGKRNGRWADTNTWIYDFEADLPGGVLCTCTVRGDLKSAAGTPFTGTRAFRFNTGAPAVLEVRPAAREPDADDSEGNDSRISEDQAFALEVDSPVTEASLLQHAYFMVDGVGERVGINVLKDQARKAILDTLWSELAKPTTLIIQARRHFPQDTKVTLVWGAGIQSSGGVTVATPQKFLFRTRQAFRAWIHCDRENAHAGCIPLLPIRLQFGAPVARAVAEQARLEDGAGKTWEASTNDNDLFVDSVVFRPPFPENTALKVVLPENLHDDAGRPLEEPNRSAPDAKTGAMPALAKFAARFGVLESKAQPALPITVRNVEMLMSGQQQTVAAPPASNGAGSAWEQVSGKVMRLDASAVSQILHWLDAVSTSSRRKSIFTTARGAKPISIPKPKPAQETEVVGLPLEAPGLYVVEIASPALGARLLGENQTMYVSAAALVTNLSVHFKWGRERSLAWVTTLDGGESVSGAAITIVDCHGTSVWQGETDEHGIAWISDLPFPSPGPRCERSPETGNDDDWSDRETIANLSALQSGVLVIAQRDGDFSFTHSEWNDGIEPWRFQLPTIWGTASWSPYTILDRPMFRAGETVHMKHIARRKTSAGFDLPKDLPPKLVIEHLGSNDRFEVPLTWSSDGTAESTWEIPRSAKLGSYALRWHDSDYLFFSPSFTVSEFRLPLMRGRLTAPKEPQVGAPSVPIDVSLQYLSGGAASAAPVTIRASLLPAAFSTPPHLGEFTFANGTVTAGKRELTDEAAASTAVHQSDRITLDANGTAVDVVKELPRDGVARDLHLEMEYRDTNGQVQTTAQSLRLWPAAQLVGVSIDNSAGAEHKLTAQAIVVDVNLKPIAGARVEVQAFKRLEYTHRQRLVGGFYAYATSQETTELGPFCAGVSDEHGRFSCEGPTPAGGRLILVAKTVDASGNKCLAHAEVWSEDEGEFLQEGSPSDRIDLIPESDHYEAGDVARFQLRMPFREANVLVTAEREGVLTAQVVHISGTKPVIEIPIRPEFAPNVFVSALVVRGRVGDIQPTAMVDLGRPAYKLGIASIDVGWKPFQLNVEVKADRPTYRVRDKAHVDIHVATADGSALPGPAELAVAAVDEGLLELRPNRSWQILDAMMARRPYEVNTSTMQGQVIGRRHFGLKARPQGGGGGFQGTRELFDTLLLWQGRVALDAAGNANVEVPLNDSLTSFRIVAVAHAGSDRFGSGSTSIRSTQDLMVLPGVPPIARQGDRFPAEFTIRNTTETTMDATVNLAIDGLKFSAGDQPVHLGPHESQLISWPVDVPVDAVNATYQVIATAGGTTDKVKVPQKILPVTAVRTYQAVLRRLATTTTDRIEMPREADGGRGGVVVQLAASLAGNTSGLVEWMDHYAYSCLEQRVSRAVITADRELWDRLVAEMPAYEHPDGLLKFFPSMQEGSSVLTAYVLSIAKAAALPLPAELEDRLKSALQRFVSGGIQEGSTLPDLAMRKLAAVAALARADAATPALLESLVIEPQLWPTSAVLDWWTILSRVQGIPKQASRLMEVEQLLRARLTLTGSTLSFSTDTSDSLPWLLADPDINAVRLVGDLIATNRWTGELPKLMRAAIQRQRNGAWITTIANAWGRVALDRFAAKFETTAVSGTTQAHLGNDSQQVDWAAAAPGKMSFGWPAQPTDLTLGHTGTGTPWAMVELRAAVPLRQPRFAGYTIKKSYKAAQQKVPGQWSQGDVVEADIEIGAAAAMPWVVIDDPIPAGASHAAPRLEWSDDVLYPTFVENPFDTYRAYFSSLAKGTWHLRHAFRLDHAGTFQLPPTHIEAMYTPDFQGDLPNDRWQINP